MKTVLTKNQGGFTLIESIAVIVLIGIISTVIALTIVQGVRSYIFAKSNISLSQRAQGALARIERELGALTDIDINSDNNCICYTRQTASRYYRTISSDDSRLLMHAPAGEDAGCSDADGGSLLIDGVDSFSVEYENENGEFDSSPPPDPENLRAIHIELSLNRADRARTEDFRLVVSPRNTGLANAPGGN